MVEINKNFIFNNITIAFSGYNIKNIAVLAIESFLLLNPQLRKKVVYFDDESTDGTRKELEKRGIQVITWLPEIKKKYLKCLEEFSKQNYCVNDFYPIRVSAINNCIYKQARTNYLFLSDGDIIFLQNIFEDEVNKMLETKATIVGFTQDFIRLPHNYSDKLYVDYLNYLKSLGLVSVHDFDGEKFITTKRIYLNLILFNLKDLRNNGILLDQLDRVSPYDDTGQEFYRTVLKNKISYYEMSGCSAPFYDTNNSKFIHLLWASSLIRRKEDDGIIAVDKFNRIKEILLNNQDVARVCEQLNIDPVKIYEEYLSMLT